MRKLLLCSALITCLWPTLTKAQTAFSDNFSDQNLANWTITNNTASTVVWHWDNSGQSTGGATATFNSAGAADGYIILDSDGYGDADGDQASDGPENTVITSHAINCTGFTPVILSFNELYQKFQSDTPQVLISTDSVNWTPIYAPDAGFAQDQATANPHLVEIDVTSYAANQATVYIRFSWQGAWDYWWFVDDVKLFTPDADNLEALAVINNFANGCALGTAEPVGLTFINKGLNNVSTLSASFVVDNGTPYTETVTLSTPLARDSSYTYTFTQTADLSAVGVHQITAWVDLAGDTAHATDTAVSVALSIAHIDPATPYTMGFEVPNAGTEIDAYGWTTEDANGDDNTWFLSGTLPNTGSVHFRYLYNTDGATPADDWLFSTCIDMNATKAYKIAFYEKIGADNNGSYPEKLSLMAGTGNNAAAMTETVQDFGALTNDANYEQKVVGFKPSTTATYYLGFHCYSDPDEWYLNVDDFSISELAKPNAQFTVAPSGTTVTVTDQSTDAITTWNWSWGDGLTSTGQSPAAHTYAQPGSYDVCLIVTNLAGADTSCQSLTISGINDLDASNKIGLYPNPTNGFLNVYMNDAVTGSATIEIVNTIGETVATRQFSGSTIEKFNMESMAQGVYYLKISADGVKAIKKFVYVK